DPIMKTIYTLRCFYGDSLKSGEDLKANLKQFAVTGPQMIGAALLLISIVTAISSAQEARPIVSTSSLDKQIEQVIHENKYAWRLPRDGVAPAVEQGVISRFVSGAVNLVRRTLRAGLNWLEDWLRRAALDRMNSGGASGFDSVTSSLLL